jgi:NAD(P)-dependent dehydrogenase (short-subunit alcohol dehydrogenase family)
VTFRDQLLDGHRVAVAGEGGALIVAKLVSLGAGVEAMPEQLLLDEEAAAAWARGRAPLRALVFDAGQSFGEGGGRRLQASLELAWRAARAVAVGALIEGEPPAKLVFVGPRPSAGAHAEPARAALENLARTLSVEWARYAITAVAVTPGAVTGDAEVADLVCFLISEAGEYFSGCRFELGRVAVAG